MEIPAVRVKNIKKVFQVKSQVVEVLKGISFEVKPGEFLIIFGPSGCGKSTLLHGLLGLEVPTEGEVEIFGTNIYALPGEDERSEFRKTHLGMVYQQPNWIKSLSVIENVEFPLVLKRVDVQEARNRATEQLKVVGMSAWAEYMPSELSSGQQQRIALARALITDPAIIIADEPTGNLDYESGRELMELLKTLNTNSGKTIIMVTHDLEYLEFAKAAVSLLDGRIVGVYGEGDKDKLLQHSWGKRKTLRPPEKPAEMQVMHNSAHLKITTLSPEQKTKTDRRRRVLSWKRWKQTVVQLGSFALLLGLFVIGSTVRWLFAKKLLGWARRLRIAGITSAGYRKVMSILELKQGETITREALIRLALKNMKFKRTRSVITIGGMAVGIAAIVFLVSIGYGLQQVVVSRVARLEEMKQLDVSLQQGSTLKIDDKTLAEISAIPRVEMVLPLIAVVGRVNFQNSISDMAVYGVTSNYLEQSAIKPIQGRVYQNEDRVVKEEEPGQVEGIFIEAEVAEEREIGTVIGKVDFAIENGVWLRVRSGPSTQAEIVGYTKRTEGRGQGDEVIGESYDGENGDRLNKWLKADFLIWEKVRCLPDDGNCDEGGYTEKVDEDGRHIQRIGYVAEINMQVTGTETGGEVLAATDTNPIEFVEIASESAQQTTSQIKQVDVGNISKREAVVNRAMLKVIGLDDREAVGKTFTVVFVATGVVSEEVNEKVESTPVEYTIIGVTPDENTPVFYVPFVDLRAMGITNYSQVKVVVDDQRDLVEVRRSVDAMGYSSSTVADTIVQINNLFSTARTILALLGMVALAVAALGMFNTLTVSLLERIREVGLMKAMGMKSSEVRELFLTESMIMGLFGGALGLGVGFLGGKALSVILSALAVVKGVGVVDISYIPTSFVITILFLSSLVGVITGIYPAHRATKISALNALRYE